MELNMTDRSGKRASRRKDRDGTRRSFASVLFAALLVVSGCASQSATRRAQSADALDHTPRTVEPQTLRAALEPYGSLGRVYVTAWFGGVLSRVDLDAGVVGPPVQVGVLNHNVFLTPDRRFAWVTNNNAGTVSVIDTTTDRVVRTVQTGKGPRHTYFSPDGSEAYVTNEFDDTVSIFRADASEPHATVRVGMMPHFPIVVGDRVFVTNFGSRDVSVLSRNDHTVLATIPVGIGPLGAGATRDGSRVYIACHNSNHVAVIDTASNSVIARIPTAPGAVQVTVAPNQQSAYVTGDARGTVQRIDLETNAITSTISLGDDAGTHGIAFAGEGRLLLVTNTGHSTISVIDTERDTIVASIPVATGPEGIAVVGPR
jgi:YVTN family beta-propeller protein